MKSGIPGLSTRTMILSALAAVLAIILFTPYIAALSELDARLTVLPFILLALSLLLLQTRMTNRRLRQLQKVAESIGQGHFDQRSLDDNSDSIGKLARSVNVMAERIQHSVEDLERSSRELSASKEKLESQNEQLSVLLEGQKDFGQFLGNIQTIDLQEIAGTAVSALSEVAKSQVCLFYYRDLNKAKIRALAGVGLGASPDAFPKVDPGGFIAEAIERKSWNAIENIPKEEAPMVDVGLGTVHLRYVYVIPVVYQEKCYGAFLFASMNPMGETQRTVLKQYIGAFSNSMVNALSYKSVQKQSEYLEAVNQQLQEAQQAKSLFLANMSHELRTPLNSIIGFSSVLQKNKGGELTDSALKRVNKINRNGRHLLGLINDILDLSKVESGKMEFEFENEELLSLIDDVLQMLSPQAEAKAISLSQHCRLNQVEYPIDGGKFKQVLINLVGNAIKFTERGGVRVQTKVVDRGGTSICIQISDTGIGIPESKLEKIFEPFSQADATTSRNYGGTGLGLSISKTFLDNLGGEIEVNSVVGKGSTFSIYLNPNNLPPTWQSFTIGEEAESIGAEMEESKPQPRHRMTQAPFENLSKDTLREIEPRSAAGEDPVPSPGPGGEVSPDSSHGEGDPVKPFSEIFPDLQGKKVLIIDSEDEARTVLQKFIEDSGGTCRECSSPVRMREMIESFRPDIITLDVLLPNRSGWDVLQELKQDPDTAGIAVIVISILADRDKALALGAMDCINKPLSHEDFLQTVDRNVGAHVKTRRILVVDDFVEFHEILKVWMDDGNTEFEAVADGQAALEVLNHFTPHVVFLDLVMPKMDGFTFLRHFRRNPLWAKIPVVIVTGKVLTPNELQRLEKHSAVVVEKDSLAEFLHKKSS